MRIAMVGQKGIPAQYGGIERHVEELSKELAQNGHDVLVYARAWYVNNNDTKNLNKNIQMIYTSGIHTKNLDAITYSFTATLNALWRKVDVIHYHGVGPALLAWIPRLLSPRTKVISTFHCIDRYHQKWGFFARLMLRLGEKAACIFPHQTITVSKTLYNYCVNEYGCATEYIPNGVESSTTSNSDNLAQFNLSPNKYLVSVSRLVRHKGIHYLIQAYQAAKKVRPDLFAGMKLAIVGDSVFTDEYVKELRQMSAGDNDIVFTGWQQNENLTALFSHAALYISPSENEGMSLSILRAMASGKPVLASDIPENHELISDSCFRFENANVESLKNALIKVIEDKTLLAETGEHNRQFSASFNWPKITQQTEVLYINDGANQHCATVSHNA